MVGATARVAVDLVLVAPAEEASGRGAEGRAKRYFFKTSFRSQQSTASATKAVDASVATRVSWASNPQRAADEGSGGERSVGCRAQEDRAGGRPAAESASAKARLHEARKRAPAPADHPKSSGPQDRTEALVAASGCCLSGAA